ncbi:hypothetical protein BANRA_02172 [Escherichia coli]|nr:hypothetical protein BANRA_02172 [Escherichia coli]
MHTSDPLMVFELQSSQSLGSKKGLILIKPSFEGKLSLPTATFALNNTGKIGNP